MIQTMLSERALRMPCWYVISVAYFCNQGDIQPANLRRL